MIIYYYLSINIYVYLYWKTEYIYLFICKVLKELASSCIGVIRILDIGAKEVDIIKPLLKELPDIIVSTPGRLAQHIK